VPTITAAVAMAARPARRASLFTVANRVMTMVPPPDTSPIIG
jgi:hypothetical protein